MLSFSAAARSESYANRERTSKLSNEPNSLKHTDTRNYNRNGFHTISNNGFVWTDGFLRFVVLSFFSLLLSFTYIYIYINGTNVHPPMVANVNVCDSRSVIFFLLTFVLSSVRASSVGLFEMNCCATMRARRTEGSG